AKPPVLAGERHEQPDGVRAEVHDRDGRRSRGAALVLRAAPALRVDRLDLPGHPRADRVAPSGEVVRVVRVEALDAGPGAADAPERERLRHPPGALPRVLLEI